MKSLLELASEVNLPQANPFQPEEISALNLNETLTEEVIPPESLPVNTENNKEKFPSYMFNDPEWVGYPSVDMQEDIYRSAAYGLYMTPETTVLDVGCGRGDFGDYIKSVINPDVKYKGIDLNPIMIDVGKQKYPKLNLANETFNISEESDEYHDWIFHINNLIIDYGLSDLEYNTYVKSIIDKSLKMCNIGTVLFLLNSKNHSEEGIFLYSDMNIIIKKLFDSNLRFAIDNTDFENLYKIIIFKQPFN